MAIKTSKIPIILAAIFFACGCSPSKETIREQSKLPHKISISRALANDRVKIDKNQVWFDDKELGSLDLDEKKKYSELPETLPNGIHSYSVTELDNGLLLLTGGYKPETKNKLPESTDKTFLWDRSKKKLEDGPKMSCARVMHKTTKLRNGKFLITGGMTLKPENTYAKEVDVFDPKTKSITPSGSLQVDRILHSVLQTDENKILIAGGQTYSNSENEIETNSIELYSLENGTSSTLGALTYPRQGGTLFRLNDKSALMVGGYNSSSEPNSRSLPSELIKLPE
ncbi:MAG: hypothetical protein K8F91_14805 [Candidatus Obscuribacterales bacterium]|nr:hypothetical protein [Candidatus Obscuribacterales bacterium]